MERKQTRKKTIYIYAEDKYNLDIFGQDWTGMWWKRILNSFSL